MDQLDTTIDTYLEAYAEPDPARRSKLIRKVWTADGQLIDPPLDGTGHAGIDGMATALQTQFPGHTFRRTSRIDGHHGFARYEWEMLTPDGTPALTGLDVAELADDGTLRRVVGFFGPLAAA
jgi:SnoaL-like domain